MSQIPRSQFTVKKRQNMEVPMATLPVLDLDQQNASRVKKAHGNGHKNGSFDSNDVVIISDDDIFAVHEEVVSSMQDAPLIEESPTKKKRSRKSKDSTESRESDVSKKTSEAAAKSPEKANNNKSATKVAPKEVAPVAGDTNGEQAAVKEFKIVKMTSDDLTGSQRRSDRLQNASTIVNLSTMSTTESTMMSDDTVTSERRVSGRRSTRPIDDIKYTYRSPNGDDSLNGTTDATIGSEFNNDSLLTTPGTDRKRRQQLGDSIENIESPKRSRLDLSGLFSSFTSPVALLRNRFKRTNIASTPIIAGGEALLNESVESVDEMKEIDLNEKSEAAETADKADEELTVITTPLKKKNCVVM